MKIKRGKTKKISLVVFLAVFLIAGQMPVMAASNKIAVTDNDNNGSISIGDEFCIGAECFNVVENKDGEVRALAKYNLYTGANYNKIVLDINKNYIKCAQLDTGDYDCSYEYYFDGAKVSGETEWLEKNAEKYNLKGDGVWDYFPYRSAIKGDVYSENGKNYYNMTYKFYPYEEITAETKGYAMQNELARGVTGDKGNANYPIYATFKFEPFTSFNWGGLYQKGYVNLDFDNRNSALASLNDYRDNLEDIGGHVVSSIDMPNITDIDNFVYSIKGQKLPLSEWYNASVNQDMQSDEFGEYGHLGDLKGILSDDYSWLWNTSYWLKTASTQVENEEEFRFYNNAILYFISSAGDICYADSCNTAIPRAGIRPIITMAANDFELNRIDINGTVRWVDDNNSSRIRPTLSTIKLYRNGKLVSSVKVEKDKEEDLWRFSFVNLPKYDENGVLYTYTITQDDVPMYSSSITNFDVVNKYAPSADTIPNNPKTSTGSPLMYASGAVILAGVVILTLKAKRR